MFRAAAVIDQPARGARKHLQRPRRAATPTPIR
jgi:hypothetical protein